MINCRFLILLILLCSKSYAGINGPVKTFGIEEGLSNNSVSSIFQDSKGFLWIGTFDGLNRYDGYSFKVFRNQPQSSSSLVNNRVVDIDEDPDANIWVATKAGPVCYDIASAAFNPVLYYDKQSGTEQRLSYAVNDIEKGSGKSMFIGVAGKGLILAANKQTGVQIPLLSDERLVYDYHVQNVKTDRRGRVWVFVQGRGLYVYRPLLKRLELVDTKYRQANVIFCDSRDRIWLGDDYGLYHFDTSIRKWNDLRYFNANTDVLNITNIEKGRGQELVISTDGNGVYMINPERQTFYNLKDGQHPEKGLLSDAIYDALFDREGRLWIGTLRGGVNMLDNIGSNILHVKRDPAGKNGLSSDYIIAFAEEKNGDLWVGLDGEGLNYWDRKLNTFMVYRHQMGIAGTLSNNNVSAVLRDRQDRVWVSTYGGGINLLNRASGKFKHYACIDPLTGANNKNVWTLFQDSRGSIWAGTCADGRVFRYNPRADRFDVWPGALTNVIGIYEDRHANIWFGTFTGAARFEPGSGRLVSYRINISVRDFHEDAAGNLWMGTEGKGLLKFNIPDASYSMYSDADGLAGNAVLKILGDKQGNMWISTFSGLSNFNPSSGRFRNYYKADGLQSNQFNYNAAIRLSSGDLAFGGINGFSIFNPDSLSPQILNSPIYLTEVKVNNLPLREHLDPDKTQSSFNLDKLVLPYDKAVLSLDFVSLNLSSAQKIRYAYMLEGWDKEWINAGTARTATYSKLTEGSYRMRIKATDVDGIWNKQERILTIKVLPPWWRSWWAYLAYTAVICGGLTLFIRFRERQARLSYEVKLANYQMQQDKKINEKKISFFTHIAHEFRTPLTLIINPLKDLLQRRSPEAQELEPVYKNARRLLSLVDQLLLFRKAESGEDSLRVVRLNLLQLCEEVFSCFTQQAKAKKIDYQFIGLPGEIPFYGDREKLEIVLFNLLSNAFKYTDDGKRIVLSVAEEQECILISVDDEGAGMPEQWREKLFTPFYQIKENAKAGFGIGLYLVKKFTDMHFGSLDVRSIPGEGTCFSIRLLKGKTHFPDLFVFEDVSDNSALLEELSVDLPAGEPLETSEPPIASGSLFSDKCAILVVDDNADIRAYTRKVLETRYLVYEAQCGSEALKKIHELRPDLIISDVIMDDVSGVELCRLVKERVEFSGIPLILFTASASPEYKLTGLKYGADDYISKPFDNEMLLARVEGLLRNGALARERMLAEVTLGRPEGRISDDGRDLMERCALVIEANLDQADFNVKTLADQLGMSHSALYKKIKALSGKSVNELVRYVRLRKSGELLITTELNVNEVAFTCGFNDIKYFREQFTKMYGLKPTEYIKKYRKSFSGDNKIAASGLNRR